MSMMPICSSRRSPRPFTAGMPPILRGGAHSAPDPQPTRSLRGLRHWDPRISAPLRPATVSGRLRTGRPRPTARTHTHARARAHAPPARARTPGLLGAVWGVSGFTRLPHAQPRAVSEVTQGSDCPQVTNDPPGSGPAGPSHGTAHPGELTCAPCHPLPGPAQTLQTPRRREVGPALEDLAAPHQAGPMGGWCLLPTCPQAAGLEWQPPPPPGCAPGHLLLLPPPNPCFPS